MAKKTKSEVAKPVEAPAAPTPAAEPAKAASPAGKPTNLRPKGEAATDKFHRVFGEDGKGVQPTKTVDGKQVVTRLAPQAQIIANVLEVAGPDGMTRAELVAALPGAGLVTRQPVERILGYYQKPLAEAGVITYAKDPNAKPVAVSKPAPVDADADEDGEDEDAE